MWCKWGISAIKVVNIKLFYWITSVRYHARLGRRLKMYRWFSEKNISRGENETSIIHTANLKHSPWVEDDICKVNN